MSAASERREEIRAICAHLDYEVATLMYDRLIFRRFREATEHSEVMRTPFPHAVQAWYSDSILARLRRIGDANPRSRSLSRLFERMLNNPEDWSFTNVKKLRSHAAPVMTPDAYEEIRRAGYARFADATGDNLDCDLVRTNKDRLTSILADVKHIADRTLAHADKGWKTGDVSIPWNKVNEIIDEVALLSRDFVGLATGKSGPVEPGENDEWWRIFDVWSSTKRNSQS